MKQLLISITLFVAIAANTAGVQGDGLKRNVVFTFGENEFILYNEFVLCNEHLVLQEGNGYRFACILQDTLKKTNVFVFNGKRIAEADEDNLFVYDLDMTQKSGYVVLYRFWGQEQEYINIRGRLHGPFADVYPDYTSYDLFYYRKAGSQDLFVRNRGEDEGPYDEVYFPEYDSNCAYLYQLAGKWFARTKDGKNKLTPLTGDEYLTTFLLTESGKYMYRYQDREDGKVYINVDGVRLGNGYDRYYDFFHFQLENDGRYIYYYGDPYEGKIHKVDNGIESESDKYLQVPDSFGDPFGGSSIQAELYSPDKEHALFSSYRYEYVVIDGQRYGSAPALAAWYDEGKNAFGWSVVEGREWVVYELDLQ
ncbi:MAG: hypothetical protein LBS05_02530 [Tannerellaceae bacterium]|jgi:hypothetical protein|nr:hypothetical protein [Tannerellaceae bacterium]